MDVPFRSFSIVREVLVEQSIRFWDKIADRYSRQPIADEAAYRKKLQVTREYFRPDMEVLEFGCGTGSTAIAHAPYVKHIRAIDVSSRMIEIARSKTEAQKVENVTFERSSIDELDVPDQSLDAVLALSILHLLENEEAVIARVYRMLRPGGIFVSSTACLRDSVLKYIKLVAPVARLLGLMPAVKVFTTEELVASLTGAGFEIAYQWRPADRKKAVFIVARKA
jgi:ubiquinone/menaquinone biosynthesis C-methylase UbiE